MWTKWHWNRMQASNCLELSFPYEIFFLSLFEHRALTSRAAYGIRTFHRELGGFKSAGSARTTHGPNLCDLRIISRTWLQTNSVHFVSAMVTWVSQTRHEPAAYFWNGWIISKEFNAMQRWVDVFSISFAFPESKLFNCIFILICGDRRRLNTHLTECCACGGCMKILRD